MRKEKIYKILQEIFSEKVLLVVGTGASMTLDPDFGMEKLKNELIAKVPDTLSSCKGAVEQWRKVESCVKDGSILETAMDGVKSKLLLQSIKKITGNLVAGLDRKYKDKILIDNIDLPIEHFLQKLFSGLTESNPVLNIVTPNYDMLLEHCCDKLKIPFCNGFVGGIKKYYDWSQAIKLMEFTKNIIGKTKPKKVARTKPHVRLHKVHGSLNWFKSQDGLIQDNSLAYVVRNQYDRMLITPGDSKFEDVLENSREILNHADESIRTEKAFVFVGYGFNDIHINKELKNALITNEYPGIIISRGLSEKAEEFVLKSKNMWAVTRDKENKKNTAILHHSLSKPIIFSDLDIWQIDKFSKEILGD